MLPTDDSALLRQYAENNSDEAFAALVTRHINLVYSVALRQAGQPHAAEEITQAVFIILAKKAAQLRHDKALSSWLFQATRLTANNFIRSEARRHRREEEAYMQSVLEGGSGAPPPQAPEIWPEIAPLLDDAVANLREKDRQAVVLRFYEGRNLREVGLALGASEDAAEKRVSRALEKLRKFFSKRGVSSTTAIIAGAISAHSVQAAPVALAKTVTAIAVAKGAAASASTLTLIKGALKIMAWTKAKTAIMTAAVVVFAAGTTTVTVKEIQNYDSDAKWDTGQIDSSFLNKAPHIVRIIPTKFRRGGTMVNNDRMVGTVSQVLPIVQAAYGGYYHRTIALAPMPPGEYDYIANLPTGSKAALQKEIRKKFGLVGRLETLETNVLFLKVSRPGAAGLVPTKIRNGSSNSSSQPGEVNSSNISASSIAGVCENEFKIPVIDQTGLQGGFDIDLKWNSQDDSQHDNFKQALNDQLGLELVPGTAPVKMLVVERAN